MNDCTTRYRIVYRLRLAVALLLLCAGTVAALPATAATVRQAEKDNTTLSISYGEAAAWLERLPVEDRDDQIRDYALLGLASLLELDLPDLRNALYDQTPLRDLLFWDLAANRSGPGRSLYDGDGTLHVLVPLDDPYAARTIGLVLDDQRKDSRQDAEQVGSLPLHHRLCRPAGAAHAGAAPDDIRCAPCPRLCREADPQPG